MKRFFGPVLTLVWKDILLELRTRDLIVSVLVFAVLVIVVFSLALDPAPRTVALIAPGVLWVAIVFSGVLGMTRSFAMEKERGNLQGLMLAPVGRDVIFFGKMLAIFLFMIVVEAALFPIFAVLFNLTPSIPGMVPVVLLATLGIALVGTVFSAMAVNTRSREAMLPLLFFPVALPVVAGAVEASGAFLVEGASGGLVPWLPLLAVFDAVFLVVCPLVFNLLAEE